MERSMKLISVLTLAALLLTLSGSFVQAQTPEGQTVQGQATQAQPTQGQTPVQQPRASPASTDKLGQVLLMYLVLAVVFEAALTPLFSWRFFLERFDGKGIKVPVVVGVVFIVLWKYDLDIFPNLLAIFGHFGETSISGQILTALLVAGGSDGVMRIFAKLHIRNPGELKDKAAKAQRGLAAKQQSAARINEVETNGTGMRMAKQADQRA